MKTIILSVMVTVLWLTMVYVIMDGLGLHKRVEELAGVIQGIEREVSNER